MRHIVLTAGLIVLAGCGNSAAPGNTAGDATSDAKVAAAPLIGPSWKATDACKVIDKGDVAAATGLDVTETKLDGVNEMTDSLAGMSSCYYTLKGGKQVAVLLRQSPAGFEETADSIASNRKQVGDMMGPLEDVAGVGRSAFWLSKARQLNVYVGTDRYFNITMPDELDGKDPRTVALALASKLE